MAKWATEADLPEVWQEGAQIYGIDLFLEAAQVACEAFAPPLAEDADVPPNYKLAVIMQARNMWNATEVNASGSVGSEGYVFQPRPLDWHVTALLRPRRRVPLVG